MRRSTRGASLRASTRNQQAASTSDAAIRPSVAAGSKARASALAAAALALVPGPTVTVIIANSLRFGARAGMLNVAGTQAGFLIWLAIAALGLGAATKVMGVWFDVLRYAGAAYLAWLGLRAIAARSAPIDVSTDSVPLGLPRGIARKTYPSSTRTSACWGRRPNGRRWTDSPVSTWPPRCSIWDARMLSGPA